MTNERDPSDGPNSSANQNEFHTSWNPDTESPSTVIPRVLASLSNTDPVDLPSPLYEHVDPDSPDALL